jgi:hypothetical protein
MPRAERGGSIGRGERVDSAEGGKSDGLFREGGDRADLSMPRMVWNGGRGLRLVERVCGPRWVVGPAEESWCGEDQWRTGVDVVNGCEGMEASKCQIGDGAAEDYVETPGM